MNGRGSSPRLACAIFPHLALSLAWRAHPELREEAVLVGPERRPGGGEVLLAASEAAVAGGAVPGGEWRQAVISCPDAARFRVEETAISDLRWELRLALQDISPMVEWVDDTLAYLDAGARDLRWPTEAALASRLGRELQRLLLVPPRVGVGQSRFTAWAAALAADPGRARLVPPGGAPHFLAELPVEVLPLSGAVKERLREFGLTTCGDCAAIPLPLLQRQFGPEGLLLSRLCLGRDRATVNPWVSPPPCGVRRVLAGPVEDTEALRFGAPELAAELAVELAQRNLAAGRLRLLVGGEGAESWELISPPSPAMTKEELLPLVLSLMARVRRPVEVVELQALELVAPPVRQRQLFPTGGDRREEIERAAARLSERFGSGLVWRVAVRPEHPGDVPEERLAWHRA